MFSTITKFINKKIMCKIFIILHIIIMKVTTDTKQRIKTSLAFIVEFECILIK